MRVSSVVVASALMGAALMVPANADPSLRDVATEAGIAATVNDDQANTCVGDVNGDDKKDVVLSQHIGGPTQVFYNKGDGTYVLGQELDNRDPHGCVFYTDLFNRQHLLFTEGAENGTLRNKTNADWLNVNGKLVKQEGFMGVTDDDSGRGRLVVKVSIDKMPGVFIGNAAPKNGSVSYNRLYRPSPDGGLYDVPGPFNKTSNAQCGMSTDWDKDGTSEIAVCTGQGFKLYKREAGKWVDKAAGWGLGAHQMGVLFADVNKDDKQDLILAGNRTISVNLWNGERYVPSFTMQMTEGRAPAVADLNRDGNKDLYVVGGSVYRANKNEPDVLLFGDGTGRNWTNRSGLIPNETNGGGNDAVTVKYKGQDAILVTNGADNPVRDMGKRQLFIYEQ